MQRVIDSKCLYRSQLGKKISGVCAGLASYWDQPAWLIRIAAIGALILLPVATAVAYILAVLLLPNRN